MKFFIKQCEIKTNKDVTTKKIIGLSDLHYTKYLTTSFLEQLTLKVNQIQPDYIFFLGDLVDDGSYEIVINWLNSLAKIAPVYLVYGNHDIQQYQIRNEIKTVTTALPDNVKTEINQIPNLTVLTNNQTVSHNGIGFCGTDFYDATNSKEMISALNEHLPSFNTNDFNVLLSHNPQVIRPQLFKQLTETYHTHLDAIISGHTHSGLVPAPIDCFLPSNHGFYTADNGLFPNYVRGVYQSKQYPYQGIMIPALQPIPPTNKLRTQAGKLYPGGMQLIRIKKEN